MFDANVTSIACGAVSIFGTLVNSDKSLAIVMREQSRVYRFNLFTDHPCLADD